MRGSKSAVKHLLLLRSRALSRLGILTPEFHGRQRVRRHHLHGSWFLFLGLVDEGGDGLEALVDSTKFLLEAILLGLLL